MRWRSRSAASTWNENCLSGYDSAWILAAGWRFKLRRSDSLSFGQDVTLIVSIAGKLLRVGEEAVIIGVAPFEYEVLVADYTRRQLQPKQGEDIRLPTLEFIDGNAAQGGRLTPRLIGFLTEPERQFFELFCSVDGVGTKKALRAMVRPVKELAVLIEQQDAKALSALPGVGPATSERIIAKLRRKMPRFALMVDREKVGDAPDQSTAVITDTFDALLALGHNESDARTLIDEAIAGGKKFKDSESLLTAIYQKRLG
jgi:holliday junction DNA helicase RuvA